MSVDALIARVDRVRRVGHAQWVARCPAHEDRTPSLSIRELEDGRVLIHDFGGCGPEAVLAAVGLTFTDLFPERPIAERAPRVKKPWRIADVVQALEFELIVALSVLAAVHARQELTDDDRNRAGACRDRVLRFIEELRHAT
jgi:hypothetical protein